VSDATLDLIRLRCRAPCALTREALALRGRLATTAHVHLPGALDRAIDDGGGRRVFVDRLEVTLEFDPADYDDVTVAALWAGRVARALAEVDTGAPGVRVFADDRAFIGAALESVLEHGSLDAVFAELGAGTGTVDSMRFIAAFGDRQRLTALLDTLVADEGVARRLYAQLRPEQRHAVVSALRGERPWRTLAQAPGIAQSITDTRESADEEAQHEGVGPGLVPDGRVPEPGATAAPGGPLPGGLEGGLLAPAPSPSVWHSAIAHAARERAARVDFKSNHTGADTRAAPAAGPSPSAGGLAAASSPAIRANGSTPPADATVTPAGTDATPERWVSAAGGLVLLYPWLADFLVGPLPHPLPAIPNPAVAARRWALAALVDDDADGFLDDPVVRVLAGDDPAARRPPVATRIIERPEVFDTARAHVLTSFARSLPGFERSSADYVRHWFVRREAVVEPVADGVMRITLEPGPLDLLLDRLPYPLGAVRFPWTPYVIVERRRASA
jgi:Contractile injection system tape measure protein